jgi:hypothetical protein
MNDKLAWTYMVTELMCNTKVEQMKTQGLVEAILEDVGEVGRGRIHYKLSDRLSKEVA